MRGVWPIWAAHLRAARNAWHLDGRSRLAAVGRVVVLGPAGWWLARRLAALFSVWTAQMPGLDARLWLLTLTLAVSTGALTALATLQLGFSGVEPLLLLSLPVPPATRFRSLYGVVLVGQSGHLLLLQLGATGAALAAVDPARAALWLPIILCAMGVAAWAAMVATSGVLTLMLAHVRWFRAGLALLGSAGLGILLLLRSGWWQPDWQPGWEPALTQPALPPVWGLAGLAVVWGFLLGPGAHWGGRVYQRALRALQEQTRARRPAGLPGARAIARLLARGPGLAGALLYKAWLDQSRNTVILMRLLALAASVAGFPVVYPRLVAAGLPDPIAVVGYVLLVTQVTLGERATSAVAGEGERISLYLTAPISPGRYLRTRYGLFALPIAGAALLLTLILGRSAGLGVAEGALTAAAVLITVLANVAVLVWGGAWDLEPDAVVEGAMAGFLQEEAPITPRRMLVYVMSLAFQAGAVWLLWVLSHGWGLMLLGLWGGGVAVLSWRIGRGQLARLVRGE